MDLCGRRRGDNNSGTNIRAVGGIQHPAAEWMLLDGVDKLKWWSRVRRM